MLAGDIGASLRQLSFGHTPALAGRHGYRSRPASPVLQGAAFMLGQLLRVGQAASRVHLPRCGSHVYLNGAWMHVTFQKQNSE